MWINKFPFLANAEPPPPLVFIPPSSSSLSCVPRRFLPMGCLGLLRMGRGRGGEVEGGWGDDLFYRRTTPLLAWRYCSTP